MASPEPSYQIPKEIRDQILEELYDRCRLERRPTAAYASVCPEWQQFFEAKHFQQLELTVQRVADFGVIVVGERTQLVRHIRLDVRFAPPWGPSISANMRSWMPRYEDGTFAYAIGTLFDSLRVWKRVNDAGSQRLTLEIWTCRQFFSDRRNDGTLSLELSPAAIYPSEPSLAKLSEVNAVKVLLLRRNDDFELHPEILRQLLRRLPSLEKIGYERRALLGLWHRVEPEKNYEVVFENLPTSVMELTISREALDGFSPAHWHGPELTPRVDNPSSGLSLAIASQQLQHLSVAFTIDARHFFRPFWPEVPNAGTEIADNGEWSRLKTLAITSQLLRSPSQSEADINFLLEATSLAVRKMPRLLTLELWNGNGNEHGCVFRYSYEPASRNASLTWKGTWAIDITQRAAQSWRETVRQKTGFEAEIQFEKMKFRPPLVTEAVSLFLDTQDRAIPTRSKAFRPAVFTVYSTLTMSPGINTYEVIEDMRRGSICSSLAAEFTAEQNVGTSSQQLCRHKAHKITE